MKCWHCGVELNCGEIKGLCSTCHIEIENPKPQVGWICPVCGLGNSPSSKKCGHCKVHTNSDIVW